MKFHLLLLLLSASFAVFSADLVKDGKAAGIIVLSQKPVKSAQFAAAELNYHIEKITGTKLPVATVPQKGKTNIYIGASRYTAGVGTFSRQEYLVRVKGNDIFLTGSDKADYAAFNYQDLRTFPGYWDERGSTYAVYDFLEQLGVRWYAPKDIGIHYTKRKTLSVKDMEIRRKPTMEYRWPYLNLLNDDLIGDTVTGPKKKALSGRNMMLFKLRWHIGGIPYSINHSFYSFYKRFPEKKEWFAQGYGSIKPPQMCLTNEGFFQQIVKDARDYFDGKANPSVAGIGRKGLDCFPVFPMDNSSWCKCAKCQKFLLKNATKGAGKYSNNRASNYVFQFVNRVAKEIKKSHPGKIIGVGGYHDYAYPPDFKLEDNIRVVLCLHTRNVYSPETVQNDQAILNAWTKSQPAVKKNVWVYFCFPSLPGKQQEVRVFPGFFASKIDGIYREFINANVHGTFMEPSYGQHGRVHFLMDQLECYVYWKLAFNKDLKGETLINEFFRNYYGPAEKSMKELYMLVQERFTNPKYRTKASSVEAVSWGQLANKDVMNRLALYIKQAKKLAVAEPYKTRVMTFDKGIVEYMQKGYKTYQNRALQMSGSMAQSDVPYLTAARPGDPASINWNKAGFLRLYGGLKAEPLKQKLTIQVAHDGTWLYLSYEHKTDTSKLISNTVLWQNDIWESYFAKQQSIPYQMFGTDNNGNTIGVKKLGTMDTRWDKPGKIINIKKKDKWTILIALKLSEVVPDGIKPGEILYYNVIRSNRNKALGCWIPTFAGFHAPDRFGELYLMPEKKK